MTMVDHLLLLLLSLSAWTSTSFIATAFTAVAPPTTTKQSPPPPPVGVAVCPEISPATGLTNRFYDWKHGQRIRYQQTTGRNNNGRPPVVLVHGLFVNSDHWRKTLRYLDAAGYDAYALDLFGCGYSDKPPADSILAQRCNGETSRFDNKTKKNAAVAASPPQPGILPNVELGTADGRGTRIVDVDLRHPLGSPYNFYTWADLIADFTRDVVLKKSSSSSNNDDSDDLQDNPNMKPMATIVCNSIGTISSLQAVLDYPTLFRGVFVVCPNFRELHSAEVPMSSFVMPVVRSVQQLLRTYGQTAFDALATPGTVKTILKEPYAVIEAIDDTLVDVLLNPLLTPGASDVVFDTLSYSAGPLPEQQLSQQQSVNVDDNDSSPVWICYGAEDPWTPGNRVDALQRRYGTVVERVVKLPGVGHCPHDEAPELVHPLLQEFLDRLSSSSSSS
jgi:pimeloyl-ACP methyl ester carboxylesterase